MKNENQFSVCAVVVEAFHKAKNFVSVSTTNKGYAFWVENSLQIPLSKLNESEQIIFEEKIGVKIPKNARTLKCVVDALEEAAVTA